ncbi:hypothetical protein V8G54_005960 [Vigna mungo]|uniref:DUF632 domain-containing protein n=1 Tax=Vigna mungo TaxID=3915 RepID=A0AAQ3P2E2_VIGMU
MRGQLGGKKRLTDFGLWREVRLSDTDRTIHLLIRDQEVIKKGLKQGRKRQFLGEKDQQIENERNMQEMRQETRELLRVLGGRVWNLEKELEGSPGSGDEDRHFGKGELEEERDEDRGDGLPNWVKRVELLTFEGFDPLGWISKAKKFFEWQGVTEEEKVRLADINMEGSKEKVKNRSWEVLKGAVVVRFGKRNGGTIIERVAASKQSGTAEEPNGRRLAEPSVRGGPKQNVRELPEPNGQGLPDPNERGLPNLAGEDGRNRTSAGSWGEKREGRKNEGFGRKDRWKNQCPGENNRFCEEEGQQTKKGACRRKRREASKDIEDRFLRAYDSGKEVTRMLEANRIQEEWKSLEEELPPPKPPDLNCRTIARGVSS